jgi:vacuolar-type H+-ATPase catalytic subunit A/Vma1
VVDGKERFPRLEDAARGTSVPEVAGLVATSSAIALRSSAIAVSITFSFSNAKYCAELGEFFVQAAGNVSTAGSHFRR